MNNVIKCFVYDDDVFTKVLIQKGKSEDDYWYCWDNDQEPIRIIKEIKNIKKIMYRVHWNHVTVHNPDVEENQVKVIFHLFTHTPQVKKEVDASFNILTNFIYKNCIEDYECLNEEPEAQYITEGLKLAHIPPFYYPGWPPLED